MYLTSSETSCYHKDSPTAPTTYSSQQSWIYNQSGPILPHRSHTVHKGICKTIYPVVISPLIFLRSLSILCLLWCIGIRLCKKIWITKLINGHLIFASFIQCYGSATVGSICWVLLQFFTCWYFITFISLFIYCIYFLKLLEKVITSFWSLYLSVMLYLHVKF